MYKTRVLGDLLFTRDASSGPLISGITTSVIIRSSGPSRFSTEYQQHGDSKLADLLLILYEQNRFMPSRALRCRDTGIRRRSCRSFGDARQVDAEGRAVSGSTFRHNRPAALLHDSVHHREPEARALADILRRKERLEHVAARLFVHAAACIEDAESDVIAMHAPTSSANQPAPSHGDGGARTRRRRGTAPGRRVAPGQEARIDRTPRRP